MGKLDIQQALTLVDRSTRSWGLSEEVAPSIKPVTTQVTTPAKKTATVARAEEAVRQALHVTISR